MFRKQMAIATFVLAAGSWTPPLQAMATIVPGSTITATWDNIQEMGFVLNDPSVGARTYVDNTGTAVYSGAGTNTLTWGSDTAVFAQGTDYSSLEFVGNPIPSNYGSPFAVGTLTFTNGSSQLNSLIFGATLDLYDGSTFLGSDEISINTTENQYGGTGLTPDELATDADYINVCGQFSEICGQSIEAYENTESSTGSSYVVSLTGYIDGLVLTQVTPVSGPGVIGSEAPLSTVPEPAAYVLMALGVAALGGVARRQRSSSVGRTSVLIA